MNNVSTRTKSLFTAAACTVGLALGVASATPQPALPADPEPAQSEVTATTAELPEEHVFVTEPLYVIVAKKPGAPMATGGLAVQTVTFTEPTHVHVYRTPEQAVAIADPYAAVE